MNTAALALAETGRWNRCQVWANKQGLFDGVARRLCAPDAKSIYQRIQARTGVPWFIVAVIHEREASQKFDRQLGQGDPLAVKSYHVPKGWGPYTGPNAFEDAAYDALMKAAPKAGLWKDWSTGGALLITMEYNGLGYANMGRPSPYLWAGTNQYVSGKYTNDGHYNPNVVDTQLGCAGMIMAMSKIDPSVQFGAPVVAAQDIKTVRVSPSKPAVQVVPAPSIVPHPPSVTNPAPGSIGDAISKIFGHLFH